MAKIKTEFCQIIDSYHYGRLQEMCEMISDYGVEKFVLELHDSEEWLDDKFKLLKSFVLMTNQGR